VSRGRPPAGMIAAAEQEHHAMRDDVARLLPIVRGLLDRDGFTEVEAVTDVWLTLLCHDPRRAAFAGATAIVELAKTHGAMS
jgi:hypothetical protein